MFWVRRVVSCRYQRNFWGMLDVRTRGSEEGWLSVSDALEDGVLVVATRVVEILCQRLRTMFRSFDWSVCAELETVCFVPAGVGSFFFQGFR